MENNSRPTRIYLDNGATTAVDPRVLEKMLPYFTEHFGNAASASHSWGWKAKSAVESARQEVASLFEVEPSEIFFTSGATESNNWVLFGLVSFIRRTLPNEKIHIISCRTEHASITGPLRELENRGVEVTWVGINQYGQVSPSEIERAITPATKLVSIMSANNEYGSINPIKEIYEICKKHSVYLHADATQVAGKMPIVVPDLLSLSIHKIHGPKGAGILFIRKRNPKVQIDPIIYGGGHEGGMRSGTVSVPLVVGLGEACRLAKTEALPSEKVVRERTENFWKKLKAIFPNAKLNGHPTERIPGHLSFVLPGYPHAFVMPKLGGLAVSAASACSSGSVEDSPVLTALGLSSEEISQTYRLTIDRFTRDEELDQAIEIFKKLKP